MVESITFWHSEYYFKSKSRFTFKKAHNLTY